MVLPRCHQVSSPLPEIGVEHRLGQRSTDMQVHPARQHQPPRMSTDRTTLGHERPRTSVTGSTQALPSGCMLQAEVDTKGDGKLPWNLYTGKGQPPQGMFKAWVV